LSSGNVVVKRNLNTKKIDCQSRDLLINNDFIYFTDDYEIVGKVYDRSDHYSFTESWLGH